jgi:AcrR family transcriptional regulator
VSIEVALGTRAQKKQQTRRRLRDAARQLFSERGFVATQIGDIAKVAGVAHGTFYVHFENREALLDELLVDFNAALVTKLERAWQPKAATNPHATAAKLAEICLDHWHQDRGLVLAFAQRAGVDGNVESLRDGINPQVARMLAARLTDVAALSGRSLPDAELLAQALLGMWMRVGMQYLFGSVTRKRAVEILAMLSVGALGAALSTLTGPA